MKEGRNDPCSCGSKLKYKKCCLNKPKFWQWEENSIGIMAEIPAGEAITKTFFELLRFADKKEWTGACHAISAVLHVLLKEQGIHSELCVGEVCVNHATFSHSWLEINGEVFDVSIYLQDSLSNPPVFKGIDVATEQKTVVEYAVPLVYWDNTARMILKTNFITYMDSFPEQKNGLWDYVIEVGSKIGLDLSLDVRAKYPTTAWSPREGILSQDSKNPPALM